MPQLYNVSNTTILAFGIGNYESLPILSSASINLDNIIRVFTKDKDSIYQENQLLAFYDITSDGLRKIITEYVYSRSATGDTLILYFFGHGAVLNNGEFYFCTKDTKNSFNENLVPSSAVSFREIVSSLSSIDIIPCFIIDSCFSGVTINSKKMNVGLNIEYQINQFLGNSYAILTSSGSDSFSYEEKNGSFFTTAFTDIIDRGLYNHRNQEFITVSNICTYINEKLAVQGVSLARLDIGKTFPILPISRNKLFSQKIRKEKFVPSYKTLFEYLWNNGSIRDFTPDEIRKDMPSAYGNNRKFMYIWGLLEEIQEPGGRKVRKLTKKGEDFCKNTVPIHEEMIFVEDTDKWVPNPESRLVFLKDIK